MEYYSAIKKNKIMNFASKWIEMSLSRQGRHALHILSHMDPSLESFICLNWSAYETKERHIQREEKVKYKLVKAGRKTVGRIKFQACRGVGNG